MKKNSSNSCSAMAIDVKKPSLWLYLTALPFAARLRMQLVLCCIINFCRNTFLNVVIRENYFVLLKGYAMAWIRRIGSGPNTVTSEMILLSTVLSHFPINPEQDPMILILLFQAKTNHYTVHSLCSH